MERYEISNLWIFEPSANQSKRKVVRFNDEGVDLEPRSVAIFCQKSESSKICFSPTCLVMVAQ